jgi:hypothetical protein
MNIRANHRVSFWAIFALVAVLVLGITTPTFADDITGSAEVVAGSLTVAAVDNPAFASTTLNGTDQSQTDSIAISANDFTGSGDGWILQITSTAFTNGTNAMANDALKITGVDAVCDGGDCTLPTNGIGYPFTVPADTAAPAAGTFFNAAAATGMGDFTVTPTFALAIPADTYAGTYNSTVTITIATTP